MRKVLTFFFFLNIPSISMPDLEAKIGSGKLNRLMPHLRRGERCLIESFKKDLNLFKISWLGTSFKGCKY